MSGFAMAFGRLVTLLRQQATLDAQLATLRTCLLESRNAPVQLAPVPGGVLLTDGVPCVDHSGTAELNQQLLRHGVRMLSVSAGADGAELLAVAWGLATEPDPTGLESSLRLLIVGNGARSVTIQWQPPPAPVPVQRVTPPRLSQEMPLSRLDGAHAASGFSAFTSVATPTEPLHELFERFDGATHGAAVSAALEKLLAFGNAALERHDSAALVDLLDGLSQRAATAADAELRQGAGSALRRFGTPVALGHVTQQLASPRQPAAVRALVAFATAGADAVIDALVAAQDRAQREAYLRVLREMPVAEGSLRHMLGDPRWYVVRNAAYLVGELHLTALEQPLLAHRHHEDVRTRAAVLDAMARLATPKCIGALQAAVRDTDAATRAQAATALGWLPPERAQPILLHVLGSETDDDVRVALYGSLGHVGSAEAVRALAEAAEPSGKLFRRKPTRLRVAAAQALVACTHPSAVDALEVLRRDADPEVRAAASAPRLRRPTAVTLLGMPTIDG
jgi:HEAT repeat protein